MNSSEIKFKVTVDENHLPQQIEWEAPQAGEKSTSKSVMIALWDEKENNTLRIDLWTKDMMVDEMKKFYVQNMITLTETYIRASGDASSGEEIKQFVKSMGQKMGVLQ